jgi:hypothetical protein
MEAALEMIEQLAPVAAPKPKPKPRAKKKGRR